MNMKKYITASDLYNFKKCQYRPFMDFNGDSAKTFCEIEGLKC